MIKEGIYAFYKPSGITSANFLNEIKKILKIPKNTKVGHGGTLDPMAEGLLIVGVGRRFTKKLSEISTKKPKKYYAEIVLGFSSDTYDRDGNIYRKYNINKMPTKNDIKSAIKEISSKKTQFPPVVSAIKIGGEEAYKRFRRGEIVKMKPRNVRVFDYDIKWIKRGKNKCTVAIDLLVSSGFYVRSFANDLGEKLKLGGYLDKLVRIAVGEINIQDAVKLGKDTKIEDIKPIIS